MGPFVLQTYGDTPLIKAAEVDNDAVIRVLAAKGADLEKCSVRVS